MAPINSVQQRAVLLATDLQNSVLAEIAGDTNRIAYSVYGHWSAQHTVMTRLGFNGELCEARIDWYLLGNGYRAYNPRLMRFHSPDSLSPFEQGGLNAYMYCGGEPVMNKDPTGHNFFVALGANLKAMKNNFLGTYQAQRAAGQNPVTALVSTVSANGGLPETLGASNLRALQPGAQPKPINPLPTAKQGGLHHNVGGLPSRTPAGDASNYGGRNDGNNHWRQQEASSPSPSPYTMGRYDERDWARRSTNPKPTILTKSPERVRKEFTSQEDKNRVQDIRDRKDPV